jgi:hypothetical protein
MTGTDYENLTSKELKALAATQEANEKRQLAKRGVKIRKEVEAYVKDKYQLTLAQVFTASDKPPVSYKCPTTKVVWHGIGKRPVGLKGLSKDAMQQYLVAEAPRPAPAAPAPVVQVAEGETEDDDDDGSED